MTSFRYSFVIFLLCLFFEAHSTYIAGVYEHHLDDRFGSVEYNLKMYNDVTSDAKKMGVDILVFPEQGIYGNTNIPDGKILSNFSLYVPNPNDKISPCNSSNYSSVLRNISCLAMKNSIYIVVNINEKFDCNSITQRELNDTRNCGSDNLYFFNTDVAFNRNGTVIARYRKYNLFGEFLFNTTVVPTISIFQTDFNVSFGLFTCFDILFDKPTLTLVKSYNIRNIIFPTRWMSELPFLTALQIQEGWAYINNATLLAANVNYPKFGSTGSGIFQGQTGRNVYSVTGKEQSTLIVSEISKDNRDLSSSKYAYKIYPKVGESEIYDNKHPPIYNNKTISIHMVPYDMNKYTMKPLPLNKDKIEEKVCQNSVCCEFNVSINRNITLMNLNDNYYKYQFVIRNGVRSFSGLADGGIQSCAVVACTTNDSSSCEKRFADYNKIVWPIIFENIVIKANFADRKNLIHFPNVVNASIMPILSSAWSWERKDKDTIVFKLVTPQDRILTFGIFGRNFDFDSSPSRGLELEVCSLLLVISLIVHYFYLDIVVIES